jgi:lantibiotic biosynthesis protein
LHAGRLLLQLHRGQFRLYDAETGRRVLPFLSSAHNVDHPLNDPLYVLLARLAGPGGTGWRWRTLNRMHHLPRVICGRVIVAAERWTITGQQVETVLAARTPCSALRSVLPGIGQRRWLGYHSGDQVLPVDLENAAQTVEALRYAGRGSQVTLAELPHVEHPAVTGPSGRHVAELALSFPASSGPVRGPGPTLRLPSQTDWVYMKYFCGLAAADGVVVRAGEVVTALHEARAADGWFFVRYNDEGNHVRLRVKAASPGRRDEVTMAMGSLADELMAEHTVSSVQQDAYIPEVERYGGKDGLALAERLFCADSHDVAERIGSNPSELDRLVVASRDVLRWWQDGSDAGYDLIQEMREAQRRICLGCSRSGRDVARALRKYRPAVNAGFALKERTARASSELHRLVDYHRNERSPEAVADIMTSAVHMHCNRLFARDSRRMEALAYEFAIRTALEQRSRHKGPR